MDLCNGLFKARLMVNESYSIPLLVKRHCSKETLSTRTSDFSLALHGSTVSDHSHRHSTRGPMPHVDRKT